MAKKQAKRSVNKNLKRVPCGEDFSVKQKSGAVFIEGYANRATVDRGDEVIATDAWELDNFKNNPVILFNHGMDKLGGIPVGKAVAVTPTDEGLHLQVRISNSKTPEITMIRDLVEERILRAFSVGFEPKETDTVEIEGKSVRMITKAELFETSIVGIPMNQDSLFELSEKALATKSIHEIKKEYLEVSGCKKAAQIEDKLGLVDDRKNAIEAIAEDLGLETLDLLDILAGKGEITDEIVEAVESHVSESVKEMGGDEDEEEDDEEEKDEKSEHSEEDDEESDPDEDKRKDFQECVSSKIPKLIDEGKDRDEAVAVAISMCQEEGKCSLTPEGKLAAYRECFSALDEDREVALGADIDFVKDQEEAETKQAVDESQPPSEAIQTEPQAEQFGSPFLEAQKQTNVLLGSLINEMQGLGAKLDQVLAGQAKAEENTSDEEEKEDPDEEMDDQEKQALVDYGKKRLENLSQRLKNLGC